MPDYYIEDAGQLPFRILYAANRRQLAVWIALPLALLIRTLGMLGLRAKASNGTLWERDFAWQQQQDMPGLALSRWAPRIEQLQDLQFTICAFRKMKTIGNKEEAHCFLFDSDQTTLASLLWMRVGGEAGVEQSTLTFTSWDHDEFQFLTTVFPEKLHMLAGPLTPDYIHLVCAADTLPVGTAYRQHRERPEMINAVRLSVDEMLAQYKKDRVRYFDHARKIRMLRQLSTNEVDALVNKE